MKMQMNAWRKFWEENFVFLVSTAALGVFFSIVAFCGVALSLGLALSPHPSAITIVAYCLGVGFGVSTVSALLMRLLNSIKNPLLPVWFPHYYRLRVKAEEERACQQNQV